MRVGRTSLSFVLAIALAACGGDSSSGGNLGGGGGGAIGGGGSGGGNNGGSATCSLDARQAFAKDVIDEWYLFPDLVAQGVNPASYTDVQSYIDALVAPARAQSRDRFFTYITSIEEENAFFNSGASAGFGIRLNYDTTNNRVFVVEAFENAPAFGQGFDRGTELLAIGTNSSNLQQVSTLMADGGPAAVSDALGPGDPGIARTFRIRDTAGVEREVSVTKATYPIDPVSNRYGAKIIEDGGKRVGYLNLRTFIDTAEDDLRAAFGDFKAQGVSEVIIDFRYNGGGLVSIAELMGDLMGEGRANQVFSRTTFRPSKSENDDTYFFSPGASSIMPTKIAFIGTGGTASASELVANGMLAYLGQNAALIGDNTFGKPVGQIALDRAACDDRMRVVAFQSENANRQGAYYTGLASVFAKTCRAADDFTMPLGDPREDSIATALDFLAGRTCASISQGGGTASLERERGDRLLQPARPSVAQREVPGLY